MFKQTVTLYHRIETAADTGGVSERWTRIPIVGVYFAATSGERSTGQGALTDAGGVLLIPFEGHESQYHPPGEFDDEGWTVEVGDRIVEGLLDYEILHSPSELRAFGPVSTVTSIRRMPFGGLAHWKIWCDGSQY